MKFLSKDNWRVFKKRFSKNEYFNTLNIEEDLFSYEIPYDEIFEINEGECVDCDGINDLPRDIVTMECPMSLEMDSHLDKINKMFINSSIHELLGVNVFLHIAERGAQAGSYLFVVGSYRFEAVSYHFEVWSYLFETGAYLLRPGLTFLRSGLTVLRPGLTFEASKAIMDESDLTMEEYIELLGERAKRRGHSFD
ncbi:hypothetical protein Tco_0078931 [Tanacetum coccineum]